MDWIKHRLRLRNFAQYKKGWDGHDACPISQTAIDIAKKIIDGDMSIFALPCGGLELTSDNFSITINRDGTIRNNDNENNI